MTTIRSRTATRWAIMPRTSKSEQGVARAIGSGRTPSITDAAVAIARASRSRGSGASATAAALGERERDEDLVALVMRASCGLHRPPPVRFRWEAVDMRADRLVALLLILQRRG